MGGVDYGHTVIDGEVQYLSPSGMTKYDPSQDGGCYRKGYINYVMRIKEPFTGSQKLGVETHEQIEHFLKTGEITLGHLAMSARHLIPDPHTSYDIELQLQDTVHDAEGKFLGWPGEPVLAIEGVRTVGHIDLYRPYRPIPGNTGGYSDYLDNEGELCRDPNYTPEVLDWKTSSDIGKWAKLGPKLIETVQMPLYAKYATVRNPEAEHVRVSHVYMQTKGSPRAHKSTALLSLRQIDDRWEQMRSVVRTIKDVVRATTSNDVPGNLNACGAFRGCTYAGTEHCQMTETQTIDQLFGITKSDEIKGEKTMSLIDEINQLKAQDAAPSPVNDVATDTFAIQWALIEGAGKGTPPLKGDAAQAYANMKGLELAPGEVITGTGQLGTLTTGLDLALIETLVANLTPDATPAPLAQTASAVVAPADSPPPIARTVKADAAPVAGNSNPAAQPGATGPSASDDAAAVTEALACRAKGSFSTMRKDAMAQAFGAMADAYDAKEAPYVNTSEVAQEAYDKGFADAKGSAPEARGEQLAHITETAYAEGLEEGKKQVAGATSGYKLFIDATPSCPSDRLDTYIREVCALLEDQTGCKDIRCSDHDQLSFGKWKGALAALVRTKPLGDGCFVIETHNEISAVVADTLCEGAGVWVRGTK